MERIIRCNQLLIQAPWMIAEFPRVARSDIPTVQRQQFADTYREWYTACQTVILDDLRDYFDARYTTAIGGFPSIHDLLIRLTSTTEADLRHVGVEQIAFAWVVEEQCNVLRMTRREIFPRLAQIPYDTRLAIATICKRIYYESSIDPLFIDNGCLLTWWMPPLKPVSSKRMTRVMGWFDGIVLHAPDREMPIVRAVCEEIRRKPRLLTKIQEELTGILQQLAPMRSLPAAPEPVDEAMQHRQALLTTYCRRLKYLELQAATLGQNTPPEIYMEIDDLRGKIRDLEQKATL